MLLRQDLDTSLPAAQPRLWGQLDQDEAFHKLQTNGGEKRPVMETLPSAHASNLNLFAAIYWHPPNPMRTNHSITDSDTYDFQGCIQS